MQSISHFKLSAFLTAALVSLPIAQCQCTNDVVNTCSYTGLNSGCTITVDRVRPITPPTIYARKGSVITMRVINLSPFESLTADITVAKVVVQPDVFQALMNSQAGNLGKLTVLGFNEEVDIESLEPEIKKTTGDGADIAVQLKDIKDKQDGIFRTFDVTSLATEFARLAQPPTELDCEAAQKWIDGGKNGADIPDPFFNIVDWKHRVLLGLDRDSQGQPVDLGQVKGELDVLDKALKIQNDRIAKLPEAQQGVLKKLADAIATKQLSLQSRADLITVLRTIPESPKREIKLGGYKTDTDTQITWALNATPTAVAGIKRAVTLPYKPDGAFDKLLNPVAKQPVLSVTVQYQKATKVELAGGIMVPIRPFHSYSAAAVSTAGVVTGNVVQQTLTYTVVPLALVNISLYQSLLHRQPIAFFGTIGTGYNPATSSVEFGVGPSFSIRSFTLSALADIGRDTQLAGGFTVGEALPLSNPPKPLTQTVWSVKPAFAISVRIPLGGTAPASK